MNDNKVQHSIQLNRNMHRKSSCRRINNALSEVLSGGSLLNTTLDTTPLTIAFLGLQKHSKTMERNLSEHSQ